MINKKRLLKVSKKVTLDQPITPEETKLLLSFEKEHKESQGVKVLKRLAFPLSLLAGFLFVIFSDFFDTTVEYLPSWTNLPPNLLAGVDFLWDFIGEPIGKANILFHIPNIILYAFGFFGIKKIISALEHKSWLDSVLAAQIKLEHNITIGKQCYKMKKGHSLLFVGKSDFIGMQFTLDHKDGESVSIAEEKPTYTSFWNQYSIKSLYDDLKQVIICSSGDSAGEYLFFPVKDDQIFLPSAHAYDLSPHKLDILCQNIRTIEKEQKWEKKRIIIIGDKSHTSFVQSEDETEVISNSEDTISLESIEKKYPKVSLLDPTDIVLKKIISIAKGRKIVFRATKEGLAEYKKRFYTRLHQLGYKQDTTKKGTLTIGYDIFEDQTEQQTLSRKIDDYYPVVLSKAVKDALLRNGYSEQEFMYVPDIVLTSLKKIAHKQ